MNLAPLILTLLALGVILRLVPMRRVGRYLLGLIFTPIIFALARSAGFVLWQSASFLEKLVLFAAFPLIIFVGMLMLLPAHVQQGLFTHFLYDTLRGIGRACFRLTAGIFSRAFGRRN